jgi:hypothetical protein
MAVLTALRTVNLPQGEIIPALGQGTWHMAEDPPADGRDRGTAPLSTWAKQAL